MRQLLFILVFITSVSSIKAQSVKPTKEETMQWIADKIKSVLANNPTRITYENGILFLYYEKETYCAKAIKIDLNAVTNIDTGFRNAESPTYYTDEKAEKKDGKVSVYRLVLKGTKVAPVYWKCGSSWEERADGTYDFNAVSLAKKSFANSKAEGISDVFLIEGLYDRMIKAVKTLIEYNTKSKSGEVF